MRTLRPLVVPVNPSRYENPETASQPGRSPVARGGVEDEFGFIGSSFPRARKRLFHNTVVLSSGQSFIRVPSGINQPSPASHVSFGLFFDPGGRPGPRFG